MLMENTHLILGKRWKGWQNPLKVGGTSCYWLIEPNKGKQIVAYRKTLKNDYVNGPHVGYILL